jgi:Ras family
MYRFSCDPSLSTISFLSFVTVYMIYFLLSCAFLFELLIFVLFFFFFVLWCFQAVSYEEGEALAKEYNIFFFETSAKQDMNVEKAFLKIATDVKDRLMSDGGSGVPSGGHKLATGPSSGSSSKSGCCGGSK